MDFTIDFIKLFWWHIYLVSPLLTFLLMIILISGQLVRKSENWSIFDAVYWSLVTATTVGYGDFRPVAKVSKIISIVIAMCGIMFTGIIVAITLNTTILVLEKNLDKKVFEKIIGYQQNIDHIGVNK